MLPHNIGQGLLWEAKGQFEPGGLQDLAGRDALSYGYYLFLSHVWTPEGPLLVALLLHLTHRLHNEGGGS